MADSSNPIDWAEVAKGVAEALPLKDAYKDLLQPTAQQLGQTMGLLGQTINALLLPVQFFNLEKRQQFERRVAEKLAGITPEHLQPPPPYIAGPLLQAMMFSGDDPPLRDLYENLLASSMDTESVAKTHPAFVEVLKQLTPDEARIIKLFHGKEDFPLASMRARLPYNPNTFNETIRHFSLIGEEAGCVHPEITPMYLDNLSRLGLCEVQEDKSVAETPYSGNPYFQLSSHPEVSKAENEFRAQGLEPEFYGYRLFITSFGRQFCEACVRPEPNFLSSK